jgi:hypothetical protein
MSVLAKQNLSGPSLATLLMVANTVRKGKNVPEVVLDSLVPFHGSKLSDTQLGKAVNAWLTLPKHDRRVNQVWIGLCDEQQTRSMKKELK